MDASRIERPIGVKLTLVALLALIVGSFAYVSLFGVNYLYDSVVNSVGLALAVSAFVGLFLMKPWGAALTAVTAAFNAAAQMSNLQYAQYSLANFTFADYLTGIIIPIGSLIVSLCVTAYISRQIFQNKFNPVPKRAPFAAFGAAVICIFFIAYQLVWVSFYQSINAYAAIVIALVVLSAVSLTRQNRWGNVILQFTAGILLFTSIDDLQWTITNGSGAFPNTLWYIGVLTMTSVGIILAAAQTYWGAVRAFAYSRNEFAASRNAIKTQ